MIIHYFLLQYATERVHLFNFETYAKVALHRLTPVRDIHLTWLQKLKNTSDVFSSRNSWQRASYFSSGTSSFLGRNSPYRDCKHHSDWNCSKNCTTSRLSYEGHSRNCLTYHYHDPWWKMTYHDDYQGNLQQCLK